MRVITKRILIAPVIIPLFILSWLFYQLKRLCEGINDWIMVVGEWIIHSTHTSDKDLRQEKQNK